MDGVDLKLYEIREYWGRFLAEKRSSGGVSPMINGQQPGMQHHYRSVQQFRPAPPLYHHQQHTPHQYHYIRKQLIE